MNCLFQKRLLMPWNCDRCGGDPKRVGGLKIWCVSLWTYVVVARLKLREWVRHQLHLMPSSYRSCTEWSTGSVGRPRGSCEADSDLCDVLVDDDGFCGH